MHNRVKVVHIINNLGMGGAETLVKDYALHMDSALFDVTIIISRLKQGAVYEELLREAGIRVIYISEIFRKFRLTPKILDRAVKTLLLIPFFTNRILEDIAPDAIHLHIGSFLYSYSRAAVKYAQRNRIKCFKTVHNNPQIRFKSSWIRRYDYKFLLKHKNVRLIALHDEMKEELMDMFASDDVVTVRNAINLRRFSDVGISKNEMRQCIGIPSDAYVVGHIGRMVFQKNHEFLLNLFVKLLEVKPNAHLLLVGSGPLEGEIRKTLNDSGMQNFVTILSNRKDIPQIMTAMDTFVFPSRFEGLGIVLIEAQAVGLKCVVSDNVPAAAFVTNNITSLSLGAPLSEWCDAILGDIRGEAIGGSLEDYDMRKVIRQLENLYTGA